MTDLTGALANLRRIARKDPSAARLPTESEVREAENLMGRDFPQDYRRFLLETGDVGFGTLEPATVITRDGWPRFLADMVVEAHTEGVRVDWLPIVEDNADYYCLAPDGSVRFWSHSRKTNESWPDLASWIEEVWIGEYLDRKSPYGG